MHKRKIPLVIPAKAGTPLATSEPVAKRGSRLRGNDESLELAPYRRNGKTRLQNYTHLTA
jgi:hypothetical protein